MFALFYIGTLSFRKKTNVSTQIHYIALHSNIVDTEYSWIGPLILYANTLYKIRTCLAMTMQNDKALDIGLRADISDPIPRYLEQ